MAYTITFVERKGKDLFEFLNAVSLDPNSAKVWALTSFMLIDGEPITVEQVAKLQNKNYILLTEKIFSLEVASLIEENNEEIKFQNIVIKRRSISRDLITEIQAANKIKQQNQIHIIKTFISKFFIISTAEIDLLPYELVAFMFKEVNNFLGEITTPTNNITITDLFSDDSGLSISSGNLVDMV